MSPHHLGMYTGNGYLREAASEPTALPDYVARHACIPSAPQQTVCLAPASAPACAPQDGEPPQLTTLPQGVLEDVLARCSLEALCIAATTCNVLYMVCNHTCVCTSSTCKSSPNNHTGKRCTTCVEALAHCKVGNACTTAAQAPHTPRHTPPTTPAARPPAIIIAMPL